MRLYCFKYYTIPFKSAGVGQGDRLASIWISAALRGGQGHLQISAKAKVWSLVVARYHHGQVAAPLKG